MTATDDSVHDRLADARIALTPAQVAVAITLLAALGFVQHWCLGKQEHEPEIGRASCRERVCLYV